MEADKKRVLINGQFIEINSEIAEILEESYRKIQALEKQDKRHLAMHGYTEGITENYIYLAAEDVANTVIRMLEYEELHNAIESLPKAQKRRIRAYYFAGLSVEEIARREGVRHQAVSKSIRGAIVNLKKILK